MILPFDDNYFMKNFFGAFKVLKRGKSFFEDSDNGLLMIGGGVPKNFVQDTLFYSLSW